MVQKKCIPVEPHIVKRFYDENGREIGWIADNFVTHDEKEIRKTLMKSEESGERRVSARQGKREWLRKAIDRNLI